MKIKNLFVLYLLYSTLLFLGAQESLSKKNILVIHSYHQGLQWTDEITRGINSVLKDENIEIHYEYLDTKRNSSETYYRELVEFEKMKKDLLQIDFELIICSDNNALRFLLEKGDELYPGLPVIFCGVNNFKEESLQGKTHISGVTETLDYAAILDLIKFVHPRRDRVTIVVDRTPTGQSIKSEIEPILDSYESDFTFSFYQDFILEEVPHDLAKLGENDVILLLTFNSDRQGRFISYYKGIRMIRDSTDVPIYGAWDFYFGNGMLGGILTNGFSQGQVAAEKARQILEGVPVEEIPIEYDSPNIMVFDHREMERLGLNKGDLPPEAQISFKPERNSKAFLIVFLIFTATVLPGFILLALRLRQQKKARLQLEKEVDSLMDIIPICSHCKSIRDDQGYWSRVEKYISRLTRVEFSHGLCPDCLKELYPEEAEALEKEKNNPPENTPEK